MATKEKLDVMPEIQASYIKNFLKKRVGEKTKFSSGFRKDFSQSLSIFLYYLTTMIKMDQKQQNKQIKKAEILQKLIDLGFEEIAEDLESVEWKPKQKKAQQNKKRQHNDGQNQQDIEDINIEAQMNNVTIQEQQQQLQQQNIQEQQPQQNDDDNNEEEVDDQEVQSEDELSNDLGNNNDQKKGKEISYANLQPQIQESIDEELF